MMATMGPLGIIVYAPALVSADRRPVSVVQGMERALPGVHMEWEVSEKGHPIALPRRDAWLMKMRSDGGFPLLCNGDERHPMTITGWERPATLTPDGKPQFEVHAQMPLSERSIAAAADVLENVAEGAHAFWGQATPFNTGVEIAQQTSRPVNGPHRPPRGLPILKLAEDLHLPEIPHRLGWLNYWSAAASRAIGFPDLTRDADLLSRSRRTASGGWVLKLTDAPLDLDNPAHLDALLRAYDRFPVIGGRDT